MLPAPWATGDLNSVAADFLANGLTLLGLLGVRLAVAAAVSARWRHSCSRQTPSRPSR